MKRGVVMGIHKQHAVVMTSDGQFLRAPIQGTPQIGEEITFEEEYKKPRAFKPTYWYTSAAAVVLLVFLPFLFFMQQDKHPVVAYVSMDINPSIELGVDEDEKVRGLRALNADGELIIKGLTYKGINVETVAASILERAKGSHYLDMPDKNIIITSMLLDGNSELKLDYEHILTGKVDQTLRHLLMQLTAESASASITTLSVPNEVREEAAANGISSGKMAVYLMAKDEGYKLEIEQFKKQSIDKATEPVGGIKTIVEQAEDVSKEKLKKLVAREKEEKVKQQKDEEKSNAAKPSSTPHTNKPVKATTPQKPVSSDIKKGEATDKPWKNGNPWKWDRPDRPNRPNVDKKDDKDNEEEDKDRDHHWGGSKDDDDSRGNWNKGDDQKKDDDRDRGDRDREDWNFNWRDKDDNNRRDEKEEDNRKDREDNGSGDKDR